MASRHFEIRTGWLCFHYSSCGVDESTVTALRLEIRGLLTNVMADKSAPLEGLRVVELAGLAPGILSSCFQPTMPF